MLTVICSTCGTELRARDQYVGKLVQCPKCSTLSRLPAEAPSVPISAGLVAVCSICSQDFSVDREQVQDTEGRCYHRTCYDDACRGVYAQGSPTAWQATTDANPPELIPILGDADLKTSPQPVDGVWSGIPVGGGAIGSAPQPHRPVGQGGLPLGLLIGIGAAVPAGVLLIMLIMAFLPSSSEQGTGTSASPAVAGSGQRKEPVPRRPRGGEDSRENIRGSARSGFPGTEAGGQHGLGISAAKSDQAAIRHMFEDYKKAMLAHNGGAAAQYLTQSTLDRAQSLLGWTLTANRKQVESLPCTERLLVLLLRHMVPVENLRTAHARDLVIVVMMPSLSGGEENIRIPELHDIQVSGSNATCVWYFSKTPAPCRAHCTMENGSWKLNGDQLLRELEPIARADIARTGLPENEFILKALEKESGKKPSARIWDPPGR